MVKKIIHIADIHIPNDVNERHFSELTKKLMSDVLKEAKKCETPDECRIVMAGDLFHNKIRVSNEARDVFHSLMNYANAICRTIVFAGNHDMLENNSDRTDSITPTFNVDGAYPNVNFIDKTLGYKSGFLVDEGIVWVLYSMFDKFAKPNIDGLREQYPEYKIVGLYHGDIPGAVTDTGRMSDSGIDTALFEGLDCVMAGHIHKLQSIRKGGVEIVYAGSAFQQNMGENISGHGFVVWDTEKMKWKHHEVANKYRTLKYEIHSYDDVANDEEQILNL